MLVNGQQRDTVSLLDRGLHYGDGLFETIAVIHHVIPLWSKHYARLSRGCERLGIDVPEESLLLKEIAQLTEQSGRHVVKLVVTRGEGGRAYFPGEGATTRILIRRSWPELPEEERKHGINLHLCEMRLATGSAFAGLKHLNRLEQVQVAREVAANGCTEGVVCDSEGFVVEGVMSNLFWIKDGVLMTPLLDRCGVAGVMRSEVIEQARLLGKRVEELRVSPDRLYQADALFLTNAVVGILPVKQLAEYKYNVDAIPAYLLDAINKKIIQNNAE